MSAELPDLPPTRNAIDPQGLVAERPYVSWSSDHHGVIELQHPTMRATVDAWGAHLMTWQPSSVDQPLVWLSDAAILPQSAEDQAHKAIRGGVPVVGLGFGDQFPDGIEAPAHGLVRTAWWTLTDLSDHKDGMTIRWQISDTPESRAIWPHAFSLELTMELGASCRVALTIINTDDHAWSWSGALHTYLACQAPQAEVVGLSGMGGIDKLTGEVVEAFSDPMSLADDHDLVAQCLATPTVQQSVQLRDPQRVLTIGGEGLASFVVWNISPELSAQMSDVPDDGWQHYACVECGWAGRASSTIEPGAQQVLGTTVELTSMW